MAAPQESRLALRIQGVAKHFGAGDSKVIALKGIDLEVGFGELLMIVGPSGCGKTTLLSVICGTLKFDTGQIDVFGNNLRAMSDSQITAFRGKNVGFIFQQFNLIPTWSVVENVSVPLLLNGVNRTRAERRAAELLAEVGIPEKAQSYPAQLSGGQQQRVAIARALAHEPRLIICDEPTAALDAASGHKIMDILRAIARRPDRCVIVVTHDSRIFSFADRIAEMEDGAVKKISAPGDLHQQYV